MLRFLALLIALAGPAYAQDVPATSPSVAPLNVPATSPSVAPPNVPPTSPSVAPPNVPPTSPSVAPPNVPPTSPPLPLNVNVAYTLFAVILICLLGALLIWRSSKSTTKGGTDSGLPISDKDLEAFRISYGFWLVIGALLVTLVVLVVTLTAFAPPAPQTTDIVAIIGAVTGVIGTLTAAFFGIQAAGAGRSQAIDTLDKHLQSQGTATTTPSKLDPSYGPHAGSTRVSIIGNGFTGANGVNFGVTPGTNFEFVNDGLVRTSSPPAVDGVDEAKIMLVFPSASPPNREGGTFYYYTISPSQGGGGQSVTIRGSALNDVKAVKFGKKEVAVTAGPVGSPLKVMTPSREEAGNIDDVDVALIYPVDKATNFFVIGKYHYGPAVAGPPTPTTPTPTPQPVPPGPGAPLASGPDRFPASVELTLAWEGGNDDDPNDHGGRTSRGITQREWDPWRQTHPGLPSDVWQAPQEQIVAIYRQKYWDPMSCGQLPPGVDYCVFDYGVNSGIGRAPKVLQQLVGTTVDGEIGPLTIATAAKADAVQLINKICDQRLTFLKGLGSWVHFGNGWTRRVEGVRKQATAMVSATTMPAPDKMEPSSSPAATGTPTQLAVIRDLVARGVHAEHDNPEIMKWPGFIASKFTDMTTYCNDYQHDTIAWCGLTMAFCIANAGIRPPFDPSDELKSFLWAFAWRGWGDQVWDIDSGVPVSQAKPQPGDICVFDWGPNPGHDAGQGHVTMYDHTVDTDDNFWCSGGNQGNHLCSTSPMSMAHCVAIRRAPAPPAVAAVPAGSGATAPAASAPSAGGPG